jgi:hypothetical protein
MEENNRKKKPNPTQKPKLNLAPPSVKETAYKRTIGGRGQLKPAENGRANLKNQ